MICLHVVRIELHNYSSASFQNQNSFVFAVAAVNEICIFKNISKQCNSQYYLLEFHCAVEYGRRLVVLHLGSNSQCQHLYYLYEHRVLLQHWSSQ